MKNLLRAFTRYQENNELKGEELMTSFFDKSIYIDSTAWTLTDIEHRAKEQGKSISFEEVKDVAGLLVKYHDANEGINWGTIDVWVDHVISKR